MEWNKKLISLVTVVMVTSFMGTFLISSINIAMPAIAQSFDLSAVMVSWVVTSFLLSSAMFLLPAGRWGDLTGVRRLFKTGIVIFTFSTLLCGLSGSGGWLILFRFLQGIGAAFTNTSGAALLVAAFPPRYRGRVLGMSVSAVYLGLAVGPFAGGLLTQYLGWRSIFYLSAFLGSVTTFLAFLFLGQEETAPGQGRRISALGTFFYMAGLVAIVYGSSVIPGIRGWILMGGGGLLLVLFWMSEKKSSIPLIDTRLFTHNRLFAFSNLAALINYSATFAIVFLLSLYLQKVRGLTPRDAGALLMAQPVVMAILSPFAGRLSDKIQPRFLTTAGMTLSALGLAAFSTLTDSTSLGMIVFLLAGIGLGFALFSSPNMNTIMSSVDRSRYGLASGTASTMRVIGQIVSMTIVTLFFASRFGNQALQEVPPPFFLNAMKWGFAVFALICSVGIYLSYSRGKMDRGK